MSIQYTKPRGNTENLITPTDYENALSVAVVLLGCESEDEVLVQQGNYYIDKNRDKDGNITVIVYDRESIKQNPHKSRTLVINKNTDGLIEVLEERDSRLTTHFIFDSSQRGDLRFSAYCQLEGHKHYSYGFKGDIVKKQNNYNNDLTFTDWDLSYISEYILPRIALIKTILSNHNSSILGSE